jgi:acetyl esterase/lipase
LKGLPPTFIVNAEFDTIRASGEAYGISLFEAGNDVQIVKDLGTTHAILASPLNPAARVSTQRIADWILQSKFS